MGHGGHICNLGSQEHLQLHSEFKGREIQPQKQNKTITHKGTRQTGDFVRHNREPRGQRESTIESEEKIDPLPS